MFDVDGTVTVGGRGAGNVTVSFGLAGRSRLPLGRSVPGPATTDKLGRFTQRGFLDGITYAAAPSSPGVRFQPAKATFDARHRGLSFTGTVSTFAASGVVRQPAPLRPAGKPPGIAGVTITFVRIAGRTDVPVPAAVTTGADGTWRQRGFQTGSRYNAVPTKSGLAFSPPSAPIQPVVSSELTGSSSVFSTAGRVSTAGGAVEAGVTIRFARTSGSGPVPPAVTTDGAGAYSQTGFDRASRYRVTPSKRGLTFDPPAGDVAVRPNALAVLVANFERRTNLVVTGQVLTTAGAGLLSTVLTFTRVSGPGAVPLPVTTGSNGEYRAAGLDAGTTYAVSGVRDGFGVVPGQLRATAGGTATLNLTAFPAFEVTGVVLDTGGPIPDFAAFQELLTNAPPVAGAVVSFSRRDSGPGAPSAVVTAADGSFRQEGFEIDGSFVAHATRPGFIGATVIGLSAIFGGPTNDGASMSFSYDRAGRLDGVVLLMQRA